jgi:hypothetical protein
VRAGCGVANGCGSMECGVPIEGYLVGVALESRLNDLVPEVVLPTPDAIGGDNRGPSSDGGSYRASQWFGDDANGNFESRTDPGTSTFGPFQMKGNQGPSSATESSCGNCKTYTVSNSTSNGFFPNGHIAPYATTKITIKVCDGKVVSVSGSHTRYPNLEIWAYGNGQPQLIYNYSIGSNGPSDIGGPPVVIH